MTSILEGALAKTIAKATGFIFLDASVTRATAATGGNAFEPTVGSAATYSCKAIVDTYSAYDRAQGLVDQTDRKVLILAATLSIQPKAGDAITIRGETFTIVSVMTDPAKAVWECQGRS
jgi:hypothetical protein